MIIRVGPIVFIGWRPFLLPSVSVAKQFMSSLREAAEERECDQCGGQLTLENVSDEEGICFACAEINAQDRHRANCICADCSEAELTADND